MSDFQELIKSFPKTREYIRDFFVYGFKTRDEFREKSPRTYDNERRRLESWLGDYVRKDHVSGGANISLAIDSNLLDTNPLYQVWKTKSFTDNDIVLHFLILDLLQGSVALTAEEITEHLLTEYEALFDVQTVRRKCNAYAKEGLLQKAKAGKSVVFSLDLTLSDWIGSNDSILDALFFYQMAECFGVVGNYLTDQLDHRNESFRVKHSFCVHTLEEEILLSLLEAMNQKMRVHLEIKSSAAGRTLNSGEHRRTSSGIETLEADNPASDNVVWYSKCSEMKDIGLSCSPTAKTRHLPNKMTIVSECTPLQIFTSTRSGRRFLCCYIDKSRRFTCHRLDTVKAVKLLEPSSNYDELLSMLDRNRKHLWGVSFQGNGSRHLDRLTMKIQVIEPSEQYIVNRLKQEGRGGTLTRIERNVYQYEIEVFDANEMLPWIRTFTGRILSLECTDKWVQRRFYQDLQAMYRLYRIDETSSPNGSEHGKAGASD